MREARIRIGFSAQIYLFLANEEFLALKNAWLSVFSSPKIDTGGLVSRKKMGMTPTPYTLNDASRVVLLVVVAGFE